jgi:hypothetical protein
MTSRWSLIAVAVALVHIATGAREFAVIWHGTRTFVSFEPRAAEPEIVLIFSRTVS